MFIKNGLNCNPLQFSFHRFTDLALCACSNKSIDVWDLNTCQSVLTYPDAHSKAAHCLSQNEVVRS